MSVEEYFNRGKERGNSKDYSGAISDFTNAIRIKPDYAYAYYNRGFSKNKLKDYLGAIADYTKTIELDPNYALAYSNRGYSKDNLEDLVYYFERHIEVDADEHGPLALEMIQQLCGDNEGKWEETLHYSKRALELRIKLWDGILNSIQKQSNLNPVT